MENNVRNCVILAAGRGQRLGSLTANLPKCLVCLAGRSLLEWQLQALHMAGIDCVVVVRGYCGDRIHSAGVICIDNPEWADSSMVYSLRCAASWLESAPCLVSYGDIVFHPDIVRALAGAASEIALVYDLLWLSLWEERFEDPRADAESFRTAGGYVTEIGEKGVDLSAIQGQYIGLLKFTPAGWSTIERFLCGLSESALRTIDMTTLLQQLIKQGVAIKGVPVRGHWCEVDNRKDLNLYERKTDVDTGWSHDWRF